MLLWNDPQFFFVICRSILTFLKWGLLKVAGCEVSNPFTLGWCIYQCRTHNRMGRFIVLTDAAILSFRQLEVCFHSSFLFFGSNKVSFFLCLYFILNTLTSRLSCYIQHIHIKLIMFFFFNSNSNHTWDSAQCKYVDYFKISSISQVIYIFILWYEPK